MDGVWAVGDGDLPGPRAVELRVHEGVVALVGRFGVVAVAGGGGDPEVPPVCQAVAVGEGQAGVGDIAGRDGGVVRLEVDAGGEGEEMARFQSLGDDRGVFSQVCLLPWMAAAQFTR